MGWGQWLAVVNLGGMDFSHSEVRGLSYALSLVEAGW